MLFVDYIVNFININFKYKKKFFLKKINLLNCKNFNYIENNSIIEKIEVK